MFQDNLSRLLNRKTSILKLGDPLESFGSFIISIDNNNLILSSIDSSGEKRATSIILLTDRVKDELRKLLRIKL